MPNYTEARWQAAQLEVLIATALRAAERLERAAAGAEPSVHGPVALLRLATQELAERAQLVRGRIETLR